MKYICTEFDRTMGMQIEANSSREAIEKYSQQHLLDDELPVTVRVILLMHGYDYFQSIEDYKIEIPPSPERIITTIR